MVSILFKYKDVEVIANAVCIEHIYLNVAIPSKLRVLSFVGYLKGKSTLMMYNRHPELQSKLNKAFWAWRIYVEIIGNITDEAVQKCIKSRQKDQGEKSL